MAVAQEVTNAHAVSIVHKELGLSGLNAPKSLSQLACKIPHFTRSLSSYTFCFKNLFLIPPPRDLPIGNSILFNARMTWDPTIRENMALALQRAGRLTPEIRLAQAISQFEASLSDRAKADFKTLKSQAQNNTPVVQDVMTVTAEINKRIPKASIGPRFTNMLMAVQQFATIGDVIIGGSQNLPACGVWCVVRTSLTVRYSSYPLGR